MVIWDGYDAAVILFCDFLKTCELIGKSLCCVVRSRSDDMSLVRNWHYWHCVHDTGNWFVYRRNGECCQDRIAICGFVVRICINWFFYKILRCFLFEYTASLPQKHPVSMLLKYILTLCSIMQEIFSELPKEFPLCSYSWVSVKVSTVDSEFEKINTNWAHRTAD